MHGRGMHREAHVPVPFGVHQGVSGRPTHVAASVSPTQVTVGKGVSRPGLEVAFKPPREITALESGVELHAPRLVPRRVWTLAGINARFQVFGMADVEGTVRAAKDVDVESHGRKHVSKSPQRQDEASESVPLGVVGVEAQPKP